MNRANGSAPTPSDSDALKQRIAELEDLVTALRSGAADALVVDTDTGPLVRPVGGSDVLYQRLIERLPEGLVALSLDGTILFASRRFEALVGEPGESLIGRPFVELIAHHERADVIAALEDDRPDDAHLLVQLGAEADRSPTVVLSIEGIELPGQTARWVIVSDTDHQAYLHYLVEHDFLTELLNRRGFESQLAEHLEDAAAGAVLIIDVDHFKYVNDTLGHLAGDELLTRIAHGLAATVRGDDVIARIGGDEFAILMRSGDLTAVDALASRLLASVRELGLGEVLGLGREISVSIGGALVVPGLDVMAVADDALYQAKREGRDRAVVVGALA